MNTLVAVCKVLVDRVDWTLGIREIDKGKWMRVVLRKAGEIYEELHGEKK